jgi:hypothetical protein
MYMIKLRSLLLCCCLIPLGMACEEVVDDPGALPYHEKLVIRSVLKNEQKLDTIKITRTLPPLDDYDEQKAMVHGALVLVRHNGIVDTIPDRGDSHYFKPGITISSGDTYELTVEWNGKRATAITTIPQQPVIQSARKVRDMSPSGRYSEYLEATITARSAEAYTATSLYRYDPPNDHLVASSSQFSEVRRSSSDGETLSVRAYSYWDNTAGTEYIIVHAYDAPFYDYYTSFGQDEENLFGVSARPVKWNVRGDGIGMFIGMASSTAFRIPE